ncbi:hypothetical protein THAOC_21188 [Thalassiosira oceanica]|uniref:SGNH hydrolase-type esterase domain-containing protein n=1 Tax=Thalassiosira oceanica TaxID=159749 RepID=K0RY29_THAOC|nr:hypothetical protein THAOC_21188 [Thalassiosira oceanica]|eukprot:EJK58668.1 hypothetical protein THAOC_21188 [Thalassiosira oceanica]
MKAKHVSTVITLSLSTAITSTAISKSSCSKQHEGGSPSDRFGVPFKSMVVFGDSFSDVGNVNIASNKTQPGMWSYAGRYSDGRVWHEYLAQFLGLPSLDPSEAGGTVHAWGGATTNNDYVSAFSTALDAVVPAVDQQISEYVDGASGVVDEDALHVVSSGYNDYWWYVFRNFTLTEGQDLNMTNVYTTVAHEVLIQVRRLHDAGARHFLVGNVPNMTSWAEAQGQSQEVLNAYRTLALGHNNLLTELLSKFEQSTNDTTVYKLDYFDSMDCLNERKDFLGFRDLFNACHEGQQKCDDIFSYKFWDAYHPSTHAHFFLSRVAIQTIFDKEEAIKTMKNAESALTGSFLRSTAR